MNSPDFVNGLVVFSLGFLALSGVMLACAVWSISQQANRTLIAYENLANTVEAELKPTMGEFTEVMHGINQLRSLTKDRVSAVGHKVEDVSGSLGQVAVEAGKSSSVWGAGLMAGIKAYLTAGRAEPHDEHGKNR